MKDIIDLVTGYFTLKSLKKKGYIKEDEFNLSFTEFIVQSVQAIRNIENHKEVMKNEEKQS